MSRVKITSDEAKVKFLTKAAAGTDWRLNKQKSIPVKLYFQILSSALYNSVHELKNFHKK